MKRVFSFSLAGAAILGAIALTVVPPSGPDAATGEPSGIGRRLSQTYQDGRIALKSGSLAEGHVVVVGQASDLGSDLRHVACL